MFLFIICGMDVAYGVRGNFVMADATVGFESRGSTLAGKIIAFGHIVKGECTKEINGILNLAMDGQRSRVHRDEVSEESDNPARLSADMCFSGYKGNNRGRLQVTKDNQHDVLENSKNGLSMLFEGADLFTRESLKGMCRTDIEARSRFTGYSDYCRKSGQCRPSRSLPNYVAALNNEASCDNITNAHVTYVKNLLAMCKPYYVAKTLVGNCWVFETDSYTNRSNTGRRFPSCNLPARMEECARFNAVYDIFHALTPSSWDVLEALRYSQSIMPADYDGDKLIESI